jgi:hypothetical protein
MYSFHLHALIPVCDLAPELQTSEIPEGFTKHRVYHSSTHSHKIIHSCTSTSVRIVIFCQSSGHSHKRLRLCQPATPRNNEEYTKPALPGRRYNLFSHTNIDSALLSLKHVPWENTNLDSISKLQAHSWQLRTKYKNLGRNFHNLLSFSSNNTPPNVYFPTTISMDVRNNLTFVTVFTEVHLSLATYLSQLNPLYALFLHDSLYYLCIKSCDFLWRCRL